MFFCCLLFLLVVVVVVYDPQILRFLSAVIPDIIRLFTILALRGVWIVVLA